MNDIPYGHKLMPNGETVLVGKYTIEIRDAYMKYRVERYLIDHPHKTRKDAGRAARIAWRRKALNSMGVQNGTKSR